MEYIEQHFFKEDKRIRRIALNYGFKHQAIKLIEELSELQQGLSKALTEDNIIQALPNIKEEIADVEIMLEQIKFLLNLNQEEIEEIKEFKIDRQLLRIKAKTVSNCNLK